MSKLFKFWKTDDVGKTNPEISSTYAQEVPGDEHAEARKPDLPLKASATRPRDELFGIFELACDPATPTTVDVVAVHGLQGHPYETWEHENGILWLRDFLSKDVPGARILTFGYDSTIAFIFICHSLGGIVVKKALVLAHERSSDSAFKDILINTRAIAFLGVPHRGSASAMFADVLAKALRGATIGTSTNRALVSNLNKNSPMLADISRQFVERAKDLRIYTFYEGERTHGSIIVDKQSATIGLPNEKLLYVAANHKSICKAGRKEWGTYSVIGKWSAQLILDAVADAEKERASEQRALERQQKGPKIKRYFRLPSGGSPFFTGRTDELRRMRELLTLADSPFQRRVILWGVGGAGKTQLAFQYALKYEDEFSAVFYVNARDEASFRKDCLVIAKLLRLPEAVSGSAGDPGNTIAPSAVVEAVKEWLIDHDGDWLLIVDNADNLEGFDLNEYLPTTKKGCVIITSQNKQTAGYGPSIELGEMLAEDAQDLFIRRSGYSNPTQLQRDICLDIVTHLGYLALAVEHAAAYVQSTGMSLQKYLENLQRSLPNYLMHSPLASLHRDTVQTTLSMAFMAVFSRSKVALELLAFLAYIDNEAVLESHLLSPSVLPAFRNWKCHTGPDDLDQCKRILLSFSLIRAQVGDDGDVTLSMHSLVHRGIRLLLKVPTQWICLLHSAAFTFTITKGKPFDGSWFPFARLALKLSTELFQQHDHGDPPEALWLILPSFIFTYRIVWQITGLMHELDELCNVTVQALSGCTSDNAKLQMFVAATTRFITVQYTSGPEAGYSMMLEFLIKNMTPAAATFMQELHQGSDRANLFSEFRPHTLGEVFKDLSPPACAAMLIEMLQTAAMFHLGRHEQLTIGTVYLRLSQLPRTESWMTQGRRLLGMGSPLSQPIASDAGQLDLALCATVAARDRAIGDMNSTVTMLDQMMKSRMPLYGGWPGRFEMAVYDLAKLLQKLHRLEEARTVIQRLEYPSAEKTEISIARSYRDFYVWARKIYARSMTSHEQHPKAEAILKETYETASKVFGKASLSTLHAGYLLEQFYLLPCCLSTARAGEIREEFNNGFAQMYCGRVRMRLGEGLFMGKILLAQGGLEEAVEVFEQFAIGAERLWGAEDSMFKRARKWEMHARSERSVEIRDELAGRASLAWGCFTFSRDVNALGVEKNG